jgi:hypothetical protein
VLIPQYCNELLFRSVHWIRSRELRNQYGSLVPAIFMHLPNSSVSSLAENVAYARHVASRLLLSLVDSAPTVNHQGVVVLAAGWFTAIVIACVGWSAALAYFCRSRRRAVTTDSASLDGENPSVNLSSGPSRNLSLL